MPLIDSTYFQGEIHIANAANAAIAAKLDYYIVKYENDLLDKMLGIDFRAEFEAGRIEQTPEQRWMDLLNGTTYTKDDKTKRWIGFMNASKMSPIANYVYYKYIVDNINHTVGTGNLRPEVENGSIVSPAPKLTAVWNEMTGMLNNLVCFLQSRPSDYPNWVLDTCETRDLLSTVNSFSI